MLNTVSWINKYDLLIRKNIFYHLLKIWHSSALVSCWMALLLCNLTSNCMFMNMLKQSPCFVHIVAGNRHSVLRLFCMTHKVVSHRTQKSGNVSCVTWLSSREVVCTIETNSAELPRNGSFQGLTRACLYCTQVRFMLSILEWADCSINSKIMSP